MTTDLIPLNVAGQTAGTKAQTLARLAAADLPVPSGVIVPAAVSGPRLDEAVRGVCAWAVASAPHGLAARSSAPGEDGRCASFAGLFRSCFTGTDPDEIRAAIAAVRNSLTAPVVTSYCTRSGIPAPASMPVLIQAALRPYASGVAAAEVARGRAARWRVEAVHGLAEPLVSGRSTGEAHHSDDGQAVHFQLADQRLVVLLASSAELSTPPGEILTLPHSRLDRCPAKVAYSAGRLVQYYRPEAWTQEPILDEAQRDSVLEMAVRAAAALQLDRIDIEWALLADGRLYLLQARHLTAPLLNSAGHHDTIGWHGLPASPGTAEGTAVHLGAPLDAGSVLICEALTASTLTALLTRPAAIVAARGGTLSHTAILARELAIPCVVNVLGATTAIAPGQRLHVDGTAGIVRPLTWSELTANSQKLNAARADQSDLPECVLPSAPGAGRPPRRIVIIDADGPCGADEILAALREEQRFGVLVTDPRSAMPEVLAGWEVSEPDRLVRLIWPAAAGPVPAALTTRDVTRGITCVRPRRAATALGAFLSADLASFADTTLGSCSITATLSWPYHGGEVYEIADDSGARYILKRHADMLHFTRELAGYNWAAALATSRAPRLVAASTALQAVIVTFIPGTPLTSMPVGAPDEYDAYRQAGALLREFHALASGPPDPQVTNRLLAKADEALQHVSGCLANPELGLIRRSVTHLERATSQLPAAATHGDYQPRNLLWNHDAGNLAVIDFDKAALAPAARDLAVVTRSLSARADLCAAFYLGYGSVPDSTERAAITVFAVLNSLIEFAWGTTNGDHEMTTDARITFARFSNSQLIGGAGA